MAVELERIGWEDGTLVSNAKVNVQGTIYEVEPEQYSGSTPLSAENLKAMEDNIENAINQISSYSTDEIEIGTWINGKPIYRKVVNFGALPNASTKRVDHNITNIDEVIKISGTVNDNGSYQPIPLVYKGSEGQYNASFFVNSTVVACSTSEDRTRLTAYVIIEYTKF